MSLENDMSRSVILIDKPQGPTSFDVVETVSKTIGVKKAGHTGTLDPNATGLMVIALGEARKAMPVLTGMRKEYEGTMRLHGDAGRKEVEDVLKGFLGKIKQVPPVKSAVARKERVREVYEIELIGKSGRDVSFRVLCEAGTYIRKIAHDAGEKLGCGAHLTELRRTGVGPFSMEQSVTPEALKGMSANKLKALLMPIEDVLESMKIPKLVVRDEVEKGIRNGAPVRKGNVKEADGKADEDGYMAVYGENGKIICLARHVKKGDTVARTDRVFN